MLRCAPGCRATPPTPRGRFGPAGTRDRTPAPASEAYGNPGELELVLQKIRSNGGELRYVHMDEPFFFGHRDPSGCRLSAIQLAQHVAASVASMRRIFPELQVGDSEPVNADRQMDLGIGAVGACGGR
jgi:hypothetical protein